MPQLTRSELETAYRLMRTIREFEERLHLEFESGEIPGFVHLYAGEEASAVGVCMNLAETDRIASTHRGHGHSIAKGCDVKAMMKEIYGRVGGLCQGKGGSMHIADFSKGMMGANGIVGGGPPLACGAALSAKTLGTGGVAVAFVGDGGANQGTTAEALCLAAVWELPVIFVVEDNGYGQMNASSWALSGDLVTRAEGFGVAARRVCGHDFFAVHEATAEAVARARAGTGPSLLHVELTRFYGHFEGDAMGYRAPGEVEAARAERDPLRHFRARITEAALVEAGVLDAIDNEVASLIDAAVAEARAAPMPAAGALLDHVYGDY